jgi:uncharacterized protein (DUF1810 family)
MSIQRFIDAMISNNYGDTYNDAIIQLNNGRKTGCWIHYCLPIINMHGKKTKEGHIISLSTITKMFAIKDFNEAIEYINNDILRERLLEMLNIIYYKIVKQNIKLETLMGSNTDAMKCKSCITLFYNTFKMTNFSYNILGELYKLLGEDDITISCLKAQIIS